MQEQFTAMMQSDRAHGMQPGMGTFASFVAPMDVTPQTLVELKRLRQNKAIWLVHCLQEPEPEGTSHTCWVHLVTKEYGSNGLPLAER